MAETERAAPAMVCLECRDMLAIKDRAQAAGLRAVAAILLVLCLGGSVRAQGGNEQPPDGVPHTMELPAEPYRKWCRNPDGSCVQCSLVMVGLHNGNPKYYTLLWDSEYGKAERGGSTPSRVAAYMRKREMKGWNVTGDETFDWMKWACRTGRFAAIGAGRAHFQTLYGWNPQTNTWYVCNNNSTYKVDEYDWDAFRRLHLSSGPWVVIAEESAPAVPQYLPWWE